jgi:hypothetical protein
MQMLKLREAWKKKGNPPCDHPYIDREYYLVSHTGDSVCTNCSETNPERKPVKRTK